MLHRAQGVSEAVLSTVAEESSPRLRDRMSSPNVSSSGYCPLMGSSWTVGVDVGGSLVKGALIDVANGRLFGRVEEPTPQPSTPEAIARVVADIVTGRGGSGPVGVTLPGVIRDGVVLRAANLHSSWRGCNAVKLLESVIERPVVVVNDADAAGLAETRFGAGRHENGQVLMLTFGTGIGSALLQGGVLVPNTEMGHLEVDGRPGETRASVGAMRRDGLTYEQWAVHANRYLAAVETVLQPDLIILGGGISRHSGSWWHLVETQTQCALAGLRNDAGLVGAAMVARA